MVAELRVKIPKHLKERLESGHIDIERVIQNALVKSVNESEMKNNLVEVKPRPESIPVETSDIPPGHFMAIQGLSVEEFERVVDESSWEYIDGILIHHSPESNVHNAILNFLIHRVKVNLDPHKYIVRASRVAISIGDDKPEPDLMVFDRDDFRKARRKDGTESEIVASTPLLVIEVVSPSSKSTDDGKQEKYLSKGIREFWQILIHAGPIIVKVHDLKMGAYDVKDYEKGEIRSRHLPDFAINVEELTDPDGNQ
jgi:Uma2 family endonuclease